MKVSNIKKGIVTTIIGLLVMAVVTYRFIVVPEFKIWSAITGYAFSALCLLMPDNFIGLIKKLFSGNQVKQNEE